MVDKLPRYTQEDNNTVPVDENDFVNLSFEQLFNIRVSLPRSFDNDEEVIDDTVYVESEEFDFLALNFEQLFSIPVSVRFNEREEVEMEPTSNGPVMNSPFSLHNLVDKLNVIPESTGQPVEVKTNKESSSNTNSGESEEAPDVGDPFVPVIEEEPVPIPVGLNGTQASVFEPDLFVEESASVNGNLFVADGLDPQQTTVISVNGVTNDSEDDQSESANYILVETPLGDLRVNINTGDFVYELYDASSINDALLIGTEVIPYVMDVNGEIQSADLTMSIILNQAPNAMDDAYTLISNDVYTVNDQALGLLGNDTDPNNSDTFTDMQYVTAVEGSSDNVGSPINVGGGLLTVNANGTFDYDTNEAFEDLAPGQTRDVSFSYTIADAEGLSDTATVTLTVVGFTPPLIQPDCDETVSILLNGSPTTICASNPSAYERCVLGLDSVNTSIQEGIEREWVNIEDVLSSSNTNYLFSCSNQDVVDYVNNSTSAEVRPFAVDILSNLEPYGGPGFDL